MGERFIPTKFMNSGESRTPGRSIFATFAGLGSTWDELVGFGYNDALRSEGEMAMRVGELCIRQVVIAPRET
jgi:hypothetical protein